MITKANVSLLLLVLAIANFILGATGVASWTLFGLTVTDTTALGLALFCVSLLLKHLPTITVTPPTGA